MAILNMLRSIRFVEKVRGTMHAPHAKAPITTVIFAPSLSNMNGVNILPMKMPMNVAASRKPSFESVIAINLSSISLNYSAIGNIPMSMFTNECVMHRTKKNK